VWVLVWLSVDTWLISILSLAYLAILFVIAYWGQKQSSQKWLSRPWVYSLSLGVSCTSWAFYGMVGQVAETGAWLAPLYIGTILCFVLAWPMLLKMLRVCKEQNLTSIADFIACRYDRSPKIAATIAILALLGTIPYIALQLRAISTSFDLLTGTYQSGINTTFIVTGVLIIFSILFGTRQILVSKQNQGLVLAIAFSSVVKLFALTAIGIFVTYFVYDGFGSLISQQASLPSKQSGFSAYYAISQVMLGIVTIFILPQQFHMMIIENHHEQELKTARWLYPLYLLLINVFVLPIAIAGQLTFPGGSVDADTFVLTIPLYYQQAWLGVVAFIGGLAAATSMVIVATIVLSTMFTTEIVNPLVLRTRIQAKQTQLSGVLILLRRIAIVLILLLAFSFERLIDQQNHLASIGLLSFVLLAQFAPSVVGALYWRQATTKATFLGLIVGSLVWLYTLLLPTLFPEANWVNTGVFGIDWLKPHALFGIDVMDSVSHGFFVSLAANVSCYVVYSWLSQRSVGETLQAEIFTHKHQRSIERNLTVDDLLNLLRRFISEEAAHELLNNVEKPQSKTDIASAYMIDYTQRQLAGALGSASTRMVMKAASTRQQVPLEDVVSIVDEASQIFQFNRELLQAGVENIEQGISVVDADMRLVAWNKRYIELLDYPEHIVKAGTPIEVLLNFNVKRGIIKAQDDDVISRRIAHMRAGNSHHFHRVLPSGIVIEIRGQAMPGGGFVSTFSDITAHIEAEKALQKANENLEKRVEQRTKELAFAKQEAEAANSSKTRFLAAASHDLMQPFNALSLFTSMLQQKVQTQELSSLANNIQDSLNVVEGLLSDLVEISRLDSGKQKLNISQFSLNELLMPLKNEFTALASQASVEFSYQQTSCAVATDKGMLRRIIQNFLANAVHYCPSDNNDNGRIVLGVRRHKESVVIQVWDNGPGIPEEQQSKIFQEFERLNQNREVPGLGLGLAISERIAQLLGLKLFLYSHVGKGSCFSIELPRIQLSSVPQDVIDSKEEISSQDLSRVCILVIDNEQLVLTAMTEQLQQWGCDVIPATNESELEQYLRNNKVSPQLIVADYHLDNDENGVDLVNKLKSQHGWHSPCVICSADPSESVRQHTSDNGFHFLRKPVKALALKRIIKQLINELS